MKDGGSICAVIRDRLIIHKSINRGFISISNNPFLFYCIVSVGGREGPERTIHIPAKYQMDTPTQPSHAHKTHRHTHTHKN